MTGRRSHGRLSALNGVVHQGTTALLRWLQTAKIDTAFIDPGKPWQNGTDESFNREIPERMPVPRVVSEPDGGHNRDRTLAAALQRRAPHMRLGDLTPAEFKAQLETTHRWAGERPTGVILQ